MIIGTNFKLSSAKFLDDRQLCKDYNTLITNPEGIIYPPGFEVFCEYENKYYQYVLGSEDEYIWEERKSGVSDGTSASIKDDTISEKYTWSSAHIDSMRIDLETLITQANDYTDEIDERVLYIEGRLQWFESFDGSYESLTNKPVIPKKISELEDDIDIEGLKNNSHTHINKDILETITEEMINSWNGNVSKIENYNDLLNKPIENIGVDVDLTLNPNDLNKNIYLIKGIICGIQFTNELCIVEPNETKEDIKIIMLNSMKKIVIHKENENWSVIKEENYGIDKNNAKISNSLNIGEGNIIKENNQIVQGKFNEEDVEEKYINIIGNGTSEEDRKNIHTLDWEGNGWYGGKLSQEGVPTEDKDLITKGYADNKYETIENVNSIVNAVNTRIENINTYIDNINKENARRDVIIEALANGRKRTVETDGNDVDLMFSTEKDKVWIDKIEGDTMVNVCDQEEPIAITKSYTVEGTNHVPLQGEYDGKARPVIQGNTLVNHNREYDKSIIIGERINNRQGAEILNFEGTPNCEIKVDIDGHTAINLSTKKEDVLCKSFDSVSGNEINLIAEENSVSDLVIQGNTMVNLCKDIKNFASVTVNDVSVSFNFTNSQQYPSIKFNSNYDLKPNTVYTLVLNIYENTHYINLGGDQANEIPLFATNVTEKGLFVRTFLFTEEHSNINILSIWSCDNNEGGTTVISYPMLFEGDLTQTPELIPTEYVEGLQSTFEDKLIPYSIYNGDNLTSITETQYQLPLTVKSNTQYTVTTTANTTKYQYAVYSTDGLTEYLSYDTTVASQIFTCDTNNVLFKVRMNPSYEGDDYSFVLDEVKDKFLIVEGDWSNRLNLLTKEYFGKYRVDMSSHGKNLIDLNNVITSDYNNVANMKYPDNSVIIHRDEWWQGLLEVTNTGVRWETIDNTTYKGIVVVCHLKPNTTYTLSFNALTEINVYGKGYKTRTLTTDGNGYYKTTLECHNLGYGEITNIQLEEGTEATEYEPYHGSSKTVYLNSPLLNGDELLTKDGKLYHYHKMGIVVLNGSEDWIDHYTYDNGKRFSLSSIKLPIGDNDIITSKIICDRFKQYSCSTVNSISTFTEGISDRGNNSTTGLLITISNSKLSTTDKAGFKQWLSENPTTVVYELASPYYEEISSTEDMRFNIATNSTIEYQSNVPMANTQFLPYRNELPLLESSTQYRVTFDCDVEGIELMVSLGGTSQTITSGLYNELSFITPSLQTDGKLTIDGYGIAKIDNVLITKGDMEYKYFEGLKSGFEDGYIPENLLQKTVSQFNTTLSRKLNKRVSKATIIQFNTDKIVRYSKFDKQDIWIDNVDVTDKITLIDLPNGEYLSFIVAGLNADDDNISYSSIEEFENKEIIILEGDWSHLTEEDLNNLGKYKATIKIQNPNAPIFGKGGRL